MAVTIKDIAREAQVDKAAVSLTLNNRPGANRLRPETRERIRKVARELGYRRNLLAASTRTGVINTIAAIGRFGHEFEFRYVDRILSGMLSTSAAAGYSMRVYQDDDLDCAFEEIAGNRIGLVISLSVEESARRRTAEFARHSGIKLVYVFEDPVEGFPVVNTDNFGASREVVRHLAALGHRRIALMCAEHRYRYTKARHEGYLAGLRDAKIAPDEELIDCSEEHDAAVRRMLALPEDRRPTAFCCIADSLAAVVERVVILSGLRVPEDVSIFGFGNDKLTCLTLVPLASVEEFSFRRGERAVELLLGLDGEPAAASADGHYFIASRLIPRASVGPVPKTKTK